MARAVDRLMRRGHGPAVYGYTLSWFRRCLDAADAAEAEERQRRRLDRAARVVDVRMAVNAKSEDFRDYFNELTRE